MVKATLLYRIGSVLLVLFAAGHTFGFLKFRPATSEGRAVYQAMQSVHFQLGSSTFSYGGFYTGFGLSITVNILFLAILSWHLGSLAATNPHAAGLLPWAFVAVQVASFVLSWMYFAAVPTILSGLLVVCLGWAAWLIQTSAA